MVGSHVSVDGDTLVTVEKDKMKAYVEITAPVGGGQPCTLQKALQTLRDNQIVFGIDEDKLKEALLESNWGQTIQIATGKEPIHGTDTRISYRFQRSQNTKVDDSAAVNYRDLGLICNVRTGELLAEKIPGTDGTPGMDVMGNELLPKKGKDLALVGGKMTVVDPSGRYLFAQGDGHVALINNRVEITQVFEVRGDVDYSSGDIDFVGTVRISGNVITGFRVKAGGDVEIGGSVEGAEVYADGSVMVKGGITGGAKGIVKAGSNILTRFAENARLEAGHSVYVKEAIIQSHVKAGSSVKVTDKKAIIVGGIIQAASQVESKVLGAQLATQTVVEVGVNPHYRDEYQQLLKDRTEKRKAMENINHSLQTYQRQMKNPDSLTDKQKLALIKLLDLYKSMRQEMNDMEQRIEFLEEQFESSNQGQVKAHDMAYPGVRISIGKCIYIVNDPIKYSAFALDRGEVRVSPLR